VPLTPKAKKNRKVLNAGRGLKYVETYNKHGAVKRLFQFRFTDKVSGAGRLDGTWEDAKRIGGSGLAKRAWMWQLASGSKWIPSATSASAFKVGNDRVGFVKRNKLAYIMKIMPPGWREIAANNATKKVMAQAAKKLGAQFQRALFRVRKAA
jgi:hypothetical protein